jgi:hypothetical protein
MFAHAKSVTLKISGVAVDGKRAARRAYPAEALSLVDANGETVGRVKFWSNQLEITVDPRIRVNVDNGRIFWPTKQEENNNDAQILKVVEEKKKAALERGFNEEAALSQALGTVGNWELEQFKEGYAVDRWNQRYPFAER